MEEKQPWEVPDEIFNKRISICNSCLNLDENRRCASCGCPMDIKAKLDWFKCPIGKWSEEIC